MVTSKLNDPVFDSSAEGFARAVDAAIRDGRYHRGRVFLEALEAHAKPGGRVLDYGCGPGRLAHWLASHGFSVEGFEPSEPMLQQAERLPALPPGRLVLKRLHAPLEGPSPAAYDAIVCSSVVEYVEDDVRLLLAFASWLRPGGVALVSFANRESLWRRYAEWRFQETGRHYAAQRHVDTERGFIAKAASAGFVPMGATRFFDAPGEGRSGLHRLAGWRHWGTLGLVTLRKASSALAAVGPDVA